MGWTSAGLEGGGDPILVLLVADVSLHADGLSRILDADGRFVVRRAGPVGDELEGSEGLAPQILLLDVEDPTARARGLKAVAPHIPIFAIAGPRTNEEILELAASGISAYVGPEVTPEELGDTLERIASADLTCCHRIATALMQASAALVADRASGSSRELTPREREVVELIALAFSNKQIAERLHVELPTVKSHVHNIRGKLQLSRRGQIVTWADARAAASSPV